MEISTVIPCYNEESRIRTSFREIVSFFKRKKYSCELIFVNDGSLDNTYFILKELAKSVNLNPGLKIEIIGYAKNQGKGYAVKRGINKAKGDFIFLSDADLSTPLSQLNKLIKFSQTFDLVIGSRKQPDAKVIIRQSLLREFLGRVFSYLSKVILQVSVNDFTCGFKLIKAKKAKLIAKKMVINRWGYDSEMLKIAAVNKYKIKEIGVIWKNDSRSKVKLSLDIFRSMVDLLTIYFNSLGHKYEIRT